MDGGRFSTDHPSPRTGSAEPCVHGEEFCAHSDGFQPRSGSWEAQPVCVRGCTESHRIGAYTATRRGIIVMNTPGGNTISTAEHAFSLMVSTARNIPQADASVKSGKWDRKTFVGVELYNKTLAILGMGRIGTEIARRAIAFGMRVLAYDPYLSPSRARSLQVELVENLDDIVPQADFITMHMPLTAETKYMLNKERLRET